MKPSGNHLTIRLCRNAETLVQIRQWKTHNGDYSRWIEKRSQSQFPLYEERDPNWPDWSEECARKAAWKRANELYLIHRTDQENVDTFLHTWRSIDAEERERECVCIVDPGASTHMMNKVDLTPEEQETITVSKIKKNSKYGQWECSFDSVGDADFVYQPLRRGSRRVSYSNPEWAEIRQVSEREDGRKTK